MGIIRNVISTLTFGIVESDKDIERKAQEEKRRNTPFTFFEPITKDLFEKMAKDISKRYHRLTVDVECQYIIGTVRSVSGNTLWKFKYDYNDYGRITGNYWLLFCENSDSIIPRNYISELTAAIERILEEDSAYCPKCNAIFKHQKSFDKKKNVHICESCGTAFLNPNSKGDIIWYCDKCNAILNNQMGWDSNNGKTFWCQRCGFENVISENNIVN